MNVEKLVATHCKQICARGLLATVGSDAFMCVTEFVKHMCLPVVRLRNVDFVWNVWPCLWFVLKPNGVKNSKRVLLLKHREVYICILRSGVKQWIRNADLVWNSWNGVVGNGDYLWNVSFCTFLIFLLVSCCTLWLRVGIESSLCAFVEFVLGFEN